jgi:hypothetical protein
MISSGFRQFTEANCFEKCKMPAHQSALAFCLITICCFDYAVATAAAASNWPMPLV